MTASMTPEAVTPFRAGREPGIVAEPMAVPAFSGPHVLAADWSSPKRLNR